MRVSSLETILGPSHCLLSPSGLIFTAVEFILTKWASGVYKPSATFTEKVYTEVYQRHLSSLEELKVRSDIHSPKTPPHLASFIC
ncbi:hypothetical protein M422DRAFT_269020 [Sphaerobolus stellatus SS14]|uniref:DUF6532 domain-containing protein n=1 Tax=Sphaerobolus stellatus (strain SS14) TaxID=990650 RepID=A0A0C9U5L2_SPHS4|nr:hypothetical protein M422DRAFT_269020 [Sphaerobolus stellatus SS14]